MIEVYLLNYGGEPSDWNGSHETSAATNANVESRMPPLLECQDYDVLLLRRYPNRDRRYSALFVSLAMAINVSMTSRKLQVRTPLPIYLIFIWLEMRQPTISRRDQCVYDILMWKNVVIPNPQIVNKGRLLYLPRNPRRRAAWISQGTSKHIYVASQVAGQLAAFVRIQNSSE